MIPWLLADDPFPPLSAALREPSGLLAAGADLSADRLLSAYRQGIFPWFNPGEPVLWWSPDPRMVLIPSELKISRSLRKSLKKQDYEIRVDSNFVAVMQACAAPREPGGGTWITETMLRAYGALHQMGVAHSIEVWRGNELVGGLYGIALGRMFYGESMFSRATDASKIALVHLVRQLDRWGFGMIDCQMKTAHLASLGAREVPRSEFVKSLSQLIDFSNQPGQPGHWTFDDDLIE
ncbi:MAG: leucyl/phenylalanyl-tRNA--protein transferase [Sulfuricellaceae bacterium]|nr:leucyl/phenylalanyl-tRNA--protein transferase [Sulfuricellaceae bacterium]